MIRFNNYTGSYDNVVIAKCHLSGATNVHLGRIGADTVTSSAYAKAYPFGDFDFTSTNATQLTLTTSSNTNEFYLTESVTPGTYMIFYYLPPSLTSGSIFDLDFIFDHYGTDETCVEELYIGKFTGYEISLGKATSVSGANLHITSIVADCQFYDLEVSESWNLKSIYVETSSATVLGTDMFSGDTGIQTVNIPDTITTISSGAFKGCTGLTEVHIPDSVTTIAANAFDSCSNLRKVYIGSGCTNIAPLAFNKCDNIETVYFTGNTTYGSIGRSGIYNMTNDTLIYGNGSTNTTNFTNLIRVIGESAFENCNNVTSLILPSIVIGINNGAFKNSSLSYIEMTGVLSIGNNAFSGTLLNSAEIYANTIGDNAFYNSTLNRVTFYSTDLSSIGTLAFGRCPSLSKISTGSGFSSSTYRILNNVVINQTNSTLIIGSAGVNWQFSLTSIVSKIGENAFYGCTTLSTVTLAYTACTEIMPKAFYGCSGITNLTLSNAGSTLLIIDNSAFYGCSGITALPSATNISMMYEKAFANCTNLTSITLGNGLIYVDSTAFSGCNSLNEVIISGSNYYFASAANDINGISSIAGLNMITGGLDSTVFTTTDTSARCTSIGEGAYAGRQVCNNLSTMLIGDEITEVGQDAFKGANLPSVLRIVSPNNQDKDIGKNAFANTPIEYLECQGNDYLNEGVFAGCTNLEQVNIIPTDGYCIMPCMLPADTFNGCTSLTTMSVSGQYNITTAYWWDSIGARAFKNTAITQTDTWVSNMFKNIQVVGDEAFYGTNITVAAFESTGLNSIGKNVFGNCQIESCSLNTNAGGFTVSYGCIRGTRDVGPYTGDANTVIIGSGAVTDNSFPNNYWVGDYAFYGNQTTGLQNIAIRSAKVGDYAFYNTKATTYQPNISDGYVGKHAFEKCSNLTTVNLGSGSTTIGESAFAECTGLKTITIPSSCVIGNSVFKGCTGLETATIWGPASIGNTLFDGCTGLTTVTIIKGNQVTVGGSPFKGCTNLTTINGYTDNTNTPDVSYNAFVGGSNYSILYGGCQNTIIPGCVTTIGEGAFDGCTGLTNDAIMTNNITTIGDYAFRGCTGLTTITIPESVTSIGKGAFAGCTGLTHVHIPGSVTSFGEGIFEGCTNIKFVSMPNQSNISNIPSSANLFDDDIRLMTVNTTKVPLANYIFDGCAGLTKVIIGEHDNVVSPGYINCFNDCTNLTVLDFGTYNDGNYMYLGSRFLYGCVRLKEVYFRGTLEYLNTYSSSIGVATDALWQCGVYTTRKIHCKAELSGVSHPIVTAFINAGYTALYDL